MNFQKYFGNILKIKQNNEKVEEIRSKKIYEIL